MTHLLKEFERKAKVIKVLIGDPGDGKTTFEAALVSRMNEVPHAIPIKINLNAGLRFRPTEFMVSLILPPALLVQAALALKSITEKDSEKSQEIIEWMKSKRSWHLFRFFPDWVRAAQTVAVTSELPVNEIYEFHKSMQSWFLEPAGTKTDLSRCYARVGGYVSRVPDAPKGFTDIFILLEEFIHLYRHLNLYPVWAIDEFESIALLQVNGKNLLLSAVREIIDAICTPEGTGCLMIFTTNDGLSIIEKYPALSDRLLSSMKFTLPNIYWEVNNFSIWDTEKALSILIELYELGAKEGDLTCQAVTEMLPLHMQTIWFCDYIHSTLASKTPARSRLKHIIVEVFDILSEGSFEDQCRHFAQESASRSAFEKSSKNYSSPESNAVSDDFWLSFAEKKKPDVQPSVEVSSQIEVEARDADNCIASGSQGLKSSIDTTSSTALGTADDFWFAFGKEKSTDVKPPAEPFFQAEAQTQIVDDCIALVCPLPEGDTEITLDDFWLASEEEKSTDIKPSVVSFMDPVSSNLPDPGLPIEIIQPSHLEDATDATVAKVTTDIKIIRYTFHKAMEKSRSVAVELLTESIKKRHSLSTIGNRIAQLRDTGRLDVLKNDVIEDIKTRSNELTTFPLSLDDAIEELTCIFILSADKTRQGESKRNYLGLINAKRKVGVDFIKNDAIARVDSDANAVTTTDSDSDSDNDASAVAKPPKSPDEFKEALFNPCYCLGAMRSFAYQFLLQRGHLPPDAMVDALVLRTAKVSFDYRLAPSRNGIKFIREKNTGLIGLFRQSDVLLSNAELTVNVLPGHLNCPSDTA